MTNRENRDGQRSGSSHYLGRGEGSVLFWGGMASFFLDSSDILKLLSTQFFPLSEIKDAQCSNLCISQVIQKAEFVYVDLRFTLQVT